MAKALLKWRRRGRRHTGVYSTDKLEANVHRYDLTRALVVKDVVTSERYKPPQEDEYNTSRNVNIVHYPPIHHIVKESNISLHMTLQDTQIHSTSLQIHTCSYSLQHTRTQAVTSSDCPTHQHYVQEIRTWQ